MLILLNSRFLPSRVIKALFPRFTFGEYFIKVPLRIKTGEVRDVVLWKSSPLWSLDTPVLYWLLARFTLVHRVISLVSLESTQAHETSNIL